MVHAWILAITDIRAMQSSDQDGKQYDLYDDRESLLNNVKALKERLSMTERSLGSLSTR